MKRFLLSFVAVALASTVVAQDWKGVGRLQGKIMDADGKPIPLATVKFDCPARGGGPAVTADKNGKWSFLGLAECGWSIQVSAEGFGPKAVVVDVPREQLRLPPVNITLDKLQGPPPELVAAVKNGDEAFAAKNWTVARENYETIVSLWPDLAPQVYAKLARAYVGENNAPKAIQYLEKSMAADPTRMDLRFAAAQTALDAGLAEKGMELLAGVDDAAVTGSDGYFNVAVYFLRTSDTPNAIVYFSKAIAKDDKLGDAYYWRALSYIRDGKLAEARADMLKVLEVDPSGPSAEKAREALEQLKDPAAN